MATVEKNLSTYDPDAIPDASDKRIAIVVSEWNHEITGNLLKGAKSTLIENGVPEQDVIVRYVPGTYELPLGAQFLLEADPALDAVVCLGSVIRGETSHFDFVCQAAAQGIKDVALKYNKCVVFGVLTDDTKQQAIDRSGGKHGNKGTEAAVVALKMVGFK